MPGTEYVWNEPDRPISLHLTGDVIDRLGVEAMEAYQSIPDRGLEVGGLLLGRVEGESVHITGHQPVGSDQETFEAARSQHLDAVGAYRTATSEEDVLLKEDEVEFFRRHFSQGDCVYLLICPVTGSATFYLPENDTLRPVHEFPFRRSELAARPQQITPVVLESYPPPPPRSRQNSLLWWIRGGAVLLGMLVGAAAYRSLHPPSKPVPAVSRAPASPVPVAPPVPARLPLTAQWDGGSILVRWDATSPQIRNASKATLYIEDHNHQSQLVLDQNELNAGVIRYWPRSHQVNFRLRVTGPISAVDETIEVAGGPRNSAPPEPVRRGTPSDTDAVAPPPPQPPPQAVARQGGAARSAAAEEPLVVRPSPFNPAPKSPEPTVAPTPVPAAPVPPPARSPEPEVRIAVEPSGGSRVDNMIGHIPLLRRLKKGSQAYVPPSATHQVRPVLTARDKRALTGPVSVDVRVFIGNTGQVRDVELMRDGHHPDFAYLALVAARRWEFSPAQAGSEKVRSEVILHFKFLPEEPPPATH
jgi:outer membrane biosynthesis protein TonB